MVGALNGMNFGLWTQGVVVRWSNNINTTKVEYANKNKMMEQHGYT